MSEVNEILIKHLFAPKKSGPKAAIVISYPRRC
jgi:hypothetical protein